MNDFFQKVISIHFGDLCKISSTSPISGGCINSTYKVDTTQGPFFIKWNSSEYNHMFQCEAKGLQILDQKSSIQVPSVIDQGIADNKSYLILDWIESGAPKKDFWKDFAYNLADLHKKSNDTFGLNYDNYIGRLPQSNRQHTNWSDFFIQERLTPQIELAKSNGHIDKYLESKFEKLFSKLDDLIPRESPSLLHGDLWSGNFMIASNCQAAIFDPAVYYGHRETELAFTRLFGGFSTDFYIHYNEAYPLETGFEHRVDIHNLYPLLVHLNLFGSSYLSGITQTLNKLS